MDIVVKKEDIAKIRNYLNHSNLVAHMNDFGLSFSSMAVILTAITNEIDKIDKELTETN